MSRPVLRPKQKIIPAHDPWVYFWVFLAAGCVMTYWAADPGVKRWIFLAGFVLPLLFAKVSGYGRGKWSAPFTREAFPEIPLGWLWALLLAALALRFWKLSTLFAWFTGDDATIGMVVIGLLRKWNWKFFHGFAQATPFIHWVDWATYRLTHSSFLALWFPCALMSALVVPLGYWGARRFFSRSFSLLLAGMLAFSYWPLLLGRLALPSIFVLLAEGWVFYRLGCFLDADPKKGRACEALWLGISAGLGFLISPANWAVVFLVLTSIVAIKSSISRSRLEFLGYSICALLAMSPFLLAVVQEGYGHHISAMGFWHGDRSILQQWRIFTDYIMVLFGSLTQTADYNPVGGGILNPVLASFFFLGVMELFRAPRPWVLKGSFLLFFFLLAPGFLSSTVETLRILQVFPLVLGITALGFHGALTRLPPKKSLWLAAALLAVSAAVDLSRWVAPFWNVAAHPEKLAGSSRIADRYVAYRVLEDEARRSGPGLVFTDFIPKCTDESLAVAVYPFNAAWNPDITDAPRWMAIFIGRNHLKALAARFPGGRWYSLPSETVGAASDHVLGVIQVTPALLPVLERWTAVHRSFMELNTGKIDARNGETQQAILMAMVGSYPRLPNDPFLQSCFLEKLLYNFWTEKLYHPEDKANHYPLYASVIQSCLRKGEPDPVVREKLVRALVIDGEFKEAKVQLQRVLRLDPRNELALQDARLIAAIERGAVRLGGSGFELNPGGGR